MSTAPSERDPHEIRAEAAAWLARLRSEDRRSEDETGFRAWLAEDPRHAEAFDLVTTAWETAGALSGSRPPRRRAAPVLSRRALALGGAAAVMSAAGAGLWRLMSTANYATRVGEQRRISLEDGSHVILDTSTRVHVAFTDERRHIELLEGRAHFEVATDPLRPFLVRAGDRQVIAIGTAFDVSRQDDRVAVVVVEGRIAVQPVAPSAEPQTRLMSPGERVIFERADEIARDKPDLARVTAWQNGRAVFEDQTLAEAVVEMNRYTRRPLVIADESLATRRISGVYGTGDTEAFARSVTVLMPARVELTPTRIILRAAEES